MLMMHTFPLSTTEVASIAFPENLQKIIPYTIHRARDNSKTKLHSASLAYHSHIYFVARKLIKENPSLLLPDVSMPFTGFEEIQVVEPLLPI